MTRDTNASELSVGFCYPSRAVEGETGAAARLKSGCPGRASRGMIAVMDRDEITAEVAARLVAGQFPQWAGLPVVPVGLNGWDNTTFRLGGEFSVRLPSGEDDVPQVSKEHRRLPVLAGQLPLPIPEPVALGRRAAGFPWPWSVYRWIQGEPACRGQIADLAGFAADLAGFLAALYGVDASGGPPPGLHSAFRGGPLTTWDGQTRTAIDLLARDIDARAAIGVWERALASPMAAAAGVGARRRERLEPAPERRGPARGHRLRLCHGR
jgi:aminoglycoside phosphotransferase (APT) family kinase protein